MQKYSSQYWSVNLPTLWDAEVDEGCDVLYDKEGVGELIFTTIYQENGVSDDQLEELASEHLDSNAIIEDIHFDEFSGFVVSFTKDSEYWNEWYLRSDNILLFISYNCNVKDEETDEDVVESILDSLQLT